MATKKSEYLVCNHESKFCPSCKRLRSLGQWLRGGDVCAICARTSKSAPALVRANSFLPASTHPAFNPTPKFVAWLDMLKTGRVSTGSTGKRKF